MNGQRDVERFLRRHGLQYDAATHLLDLVSEVGELAKPILQATDYGRHEPGGGADVSNELGDALYSLLALATALDVDAEEALDGALRKYTVRLDAQGGPGST